MSFVLSPDENIKPLDYREGDKIKLVLVSDFVFFAHDQSDLGVKIQNQKVLDPLKFASLKT